MQYVLVSLVVALPIGIFLLKLRRLLNKRRSESRNPFTDHPLRSPGESLRLELQTLDEQISETLFFFVLIALAPMSLLIMRFQSQLAFWVTAAIVVSASLITCAILGKKAFSRFKSKLNCELGLQGERAVGEELNQLMLKGYRVFHDIVFDDVPGKPFNLDHVIVCPGGVYAVETKARRKPADVSSPSIKLEGGKIIAPQWSSSKPVTQAVANAAHLGKWLTGATGKSVGVRAILTYPGWWTNETATSDVILANPKRIRAFLETKTVLSPQEVNMIAHQLEQKSRGSNSTNQQP